MPKGLTLDQIVKNCPPRVIQGASTAQITDSKPVVTKDHRQKVVCKVRTTHTLYDQRKPPPPMVKHTVTVEAVEPEKALRARDTLVKVSCTCDDFWSVWEFALNKKGAANIKYCNGEPPLIKNPRLVAGCCKHIYAVLKGIRNFKSR